MADPISISFTAQQLVTVLCTAIGALGAITAAAIKLLYNNLTGRFDEMEAKFKAVEVREHNLMRSVFVLLTRLHPGQSALIVEVMEQSFADAVLTPERPNGASIRGQWKKS